MKPEQIFLTAIEKLESKLALMLQCLENPS